METAVYQVIIEFMRIIIALFIVFCAYVTIASFNPKSVFYLGDKVYYPWAKADEKKAKEEAERLKNKKPWEV